MPIGARSLSIGPRIGLRMGLSGDAVGAMSTVARDATSNVYLPANLAQWTTTMAAAGIASGNPSALHLLQEASGNPADSIGTFTLTATGTLTYQQAVAGWSTKGIVTTNGVAGIMQSSAAGLPDISTTSMLALIYALVPAASSTTRSLFQFGPTFGSQVGAQLINSANKSLRCIADPNTATGTDDPAGAQVRPLVLKINRTGGVCTLYSDREKLTPTLTATPTGKNYGIGGDNVQTFLPTACTYLYSAVFFAGAAELSDSAVRTLLQVLSWSPAW